jgi:hypothetical protein
MGKHKTNMLLLTEIQMTRKMMANIKKLWDIAWDLWEHHYRILLDKENITSSTEECSLSTG